MFFALPAEARDIVAFATNERRATSRWWKWGGKSSVVLEPDDLETSLKEDDQCAGIGFSRLELVPMLDTSSVGVYDFTNSAHATFDLGKFDGRELVCSSLATLGKDWKDVFSFVRSATKAEMKVINEKTGGFKISRHIRYSPMSAEACQSGVVLRDLARGVRYEPLLR